jgi:hypothetical protein
MITVKGIELDIDVERNEDAKRIDKAKPAMLEAAKGLEEKSTSYDEIAESCYTAVYALLGDTEADKLEIDRGRWMSCLEIFSETCTEITRLENEVHEKISKYSAARLGV